MLTALLEEQKDIGDSPVHIVGGVTVGVVIALVLVAFLTQFDKRSKRRK